MFVRSFLVAHQHARRARWTAWGATALIPVDDIQICKTAAVS